MFQLKRISFHSRLKLLSFNKTFRLASSLKGKTVMLEEDEDIDKYAHEFYGDDLPKMMNEHGFNFKDIRARDFRYSEMKLEEITEIPKTVPFLEEFKKHGLELPPNVREVAEKTKDYRAMSKMLDIAMTKFTEYQVARVLAYAYQHVPKRTPPLDSGMVALEAKYDSARINFARVRLNYALKMKEKPFFRGEYMNELAKKVAKEYYPGDLKELGYD